MSPSADLKAAQTKTLARLQSIKKHLAEAPGSARFQGKVGIVTGAGSEKGIG